MMTLLLSAGLPLCVVVTARYLFRYWKRTDAFMVYDEMCSHGYSIIDKGKSCHHQHPLNPLPLAAVSLLAAILFPIVLVFVFIMHGAKPGEQELQTTIKELEKELGMRS